MLTMFGQARSDRRASSRERENRLDTFRIRRYEIERDTLLALQEAVLDHVQLAGQILDATGGKGQIIGNPELTLHEMQMRKLAARSLDRSAAQAVTDLGAQVRLHLRSPENKRPGWANQLESALDLLGEALRHDPFA
jgi:hypothetical protein